MRQILLLILLFFAGSWIARKLQQAQARTGNDTGPGSRGTTPRDGGAQSLPEPMVRCAECGVHAPKGEAVVAGGKYFCSTEHAQRHAARTRDHDGP
ncbi:deaminase [Burkholderia sp. Bp8963]|uniref:PP0621 family protein n=1 Tax=Burkholderia sp. Bp8963 TaxID=2184547 RepID=UPI000F59223C|nr:PP0621 family protein [Burkholderia sp. Bp8963]RQS70788.1 deaminase [Burkholderia sp. Bp8963]